MDKVLRDRVGPVLLEDVAKAAGVSRATASMALRSQGTIAKKTRELVQGVADKMGYRPNLAAAMLARQRDGGILPSVPVAVLGMGFKSGYAFPAQEFVSSFTQHAGERGFLVDEPEQDAYRDVSKLLRVLFYRGVRGIVLSHSFDTSKFIAGDISPFSLLVHGHAPRENRFHRVGSQIFESARLLWEAAWERGYRRIGAAVCQHTPAVVDDFAREAAVVNCQIRHGAARIPLFLGRHGDVTGFSEWVRAVKPDAVIGFGDGHYYRMIEDGIRVPEEIGFASLHRGNAESDSFLTGMREDFHELGRVASIQLDSMIRHYEVGFVPRPHETLVAFVFNEGATLPVRKPAESKPVKKAKKSRRATKA